MQISVIPNPPHSTILFTLSLPSLPQDLPFPMHWEQQLQRISAEELDAPQSAYALDKSAWIAVLLQEVTFNMLTMTISARFADESVEEWPLMGRQCVETLNSVLRDVLDAADITEKEKERLAPPPPSPAPAEKKTKHKKQRSLAVFSYIASLVNISRPSSPTVSAPASSLPSSFQFQPPEEDPAMTEQARQLRFRARSGLVDVYRRYVANELKPRLPEGGYTAWIANSMLARSMDHMAFLVEQAGGIVPDLSRRASYYRDDGLVPSPATLTIPPPNYEEEEPDWRSVADTTSTETDGSSLHTPVDTPMRQHMRRAACSVPRSPSPGAMSPEDLETYTALHGQSLRLRQLLVHIQIAEKNAAMEERQMHAVLEIRAKRRAWSNRQFRGGAPRAHLGLGTPAHSSPLARFAPVSGAGQRLLVPPPAALSTRTMEYDVSCLFPVSEEDEDLEAGLLFPARPDPDVEAQARCLERPQIRPRTRSIHRLQALEIDASLAPDPPSFFVPPPAPVLAHATLPGTPPPSYSPYTPPPSPRKDCYDPEGGEFTLAMDLPYAPREHCRAAAHHGYEDDGWLPGIVVEYREYS